MPILPEIRTSGINAGDTDAQIQSIAKQMNEWGRSISNEKRTDVYKDNAGTNRIIIGVLPDGDTGIVMTREDVDVLSVFS